MTNVLNAKTREDLRQSKVNKLRRKGYIPGVVYGNRKETKVVSVDNKDFMKVIKKEGKNGVFTLSIDGVKESVMLHDMQVDSLRNEIIHLDFYLVDMKSEVDVEVTIELVGKIKEEDGILSQPLRELQVKALPNDIPEKIEVDISNLEIGDSVSVSDLKTKKGFEVTEDGERVIVTILAPNNEPIEEDEADDLEVNEESDE